MKLFWKIQSYFTNRRVKRFYEKSMDDAETALLESFKKPAVGESIKLTPLEVCPHCGAAPIIYVADTDHVGRTKSNRGVCSECRKAPADPVTVSYRQSPRTRIFEEVELERLRQNAKWGPQTHPVRGGTYSDRVYKMLADEAKIRCDQMAALGRVSWEDILYEEFCEVLAESDPARQREELVQVAAVAVSIIEDIDRKSKVKCDACDGLVCGDECDGRSHFRRFEKRSGGTTDVDDSSVPETAGKKPECPDFGRPCASCEKPCDDAAEGMR